MQDWRRMDQYGDLAATLNVPQARRMIFRGRNGTFAVGIETDTRHSALMAAKDRDLCLSGGIPHINRVVIFGHSDAICGRGRSR